MHIVPVKDLSAFVGLEHLVEEEFVLFFVDCELAVDDIAIRLPQHHFFQMLHILRTISFQNVFQNYELDFVMI